MADDAQYYALMRLEQYLTEQSLKHICIQCGSSFVPFEDMGKRKCSLHPMSVRDSHLSAGEFFGLGAGTSRVKQHHFACCGSFALYPFPKDLRHEIFSRYDGCTPSDHVSTQVWRELITHPNVDHKVGFAGPMVSDASRSARHWLRIYPISIIWVIAALRFPDDHTLTLDKAIRSVMGENFYTVFDAEKVLSRHVSDRKLVARAGTREFNLDVREAYMGMLLDFGLPWTLLSDESAALAPAMVQVKTEMTDERSSSALSRALSLVAGTPGASSSSKSVTPKSLASRAHAKTPSLPLASPLLSTSTHIHRSPSRDETEDEDRHEMGSTEPTSYKTLYGKLFGQDAASVGPITSASSGPKVKRNDLYSVDADALIKSGNTFGQDPIQRVVALARQRARQPIEDPMADYRLRMEEVNHAYAEAIRQVLADTSGRAFFPFVIGSWMNVTVLDAKTQGLIHKDCVLTQNLLYTPEWY